VRGLGGFVRSSWDEVNEIIAAANVYTIKKHGPDRVIGFSPIPAMSMVSYAAGSRYLSLIGGVCMSFYDWYCDLPPVSPQTWGEQTDVPESADWYNSTFIIAWGSNVPQTRTPDAHFFTEVRYKGAKTVAVTPDYAEVAKLADLWLHPKQGTDAALAMAMGHVILKEFYFDKRSEYFDDYARRYTDLPMLVMLDAAGGATVLVPDRYLRAIRLQRRLGQANNPEWKTVAFDEPAARWCCPTARSASAGARTGAPTGKWNLETRSAHTATRSSCAVGLEASRRRNRGRSASPTSAASPRRTSRTSQRAGATCWCARCPVQRIALGQGRRANARRWSRRCSTCWPRNYGVDARPRRRRRRLELRRRAPYTPAWQEKITGVPRDQVIAWRASSPTTPTRPRQVDGHHRRGDEPLVPLRHELPRRHQHADDVRLRRPERRRLGALRGQEKLRPQTGWTALAFALDWIRPPRQHEQHQLLLRAHRPVALREARRRGDPLAAGRPRASSAAA
jgi:nitrate reductase / nitrite oxidoreductase, alpha subunit